MSTTPTTPIDLVALDLDGTLLAPDESVSPRNRTAIAAALAAGIRVVLVTGRGVDTPIRVSKELGLNLPVICCHGALTKDFGANKILEHVPVPLQYAKPMIEFAEREGLAIAVYHDEAFHRLEGSKIYMDDMRGPGWREAASLSEMLRGGAPTFIRFLGPESVQRMQREFGDLPLAFRYETWQDFVECAVLSREASKKNALAKLCADFGVSAERVLAIGDSRNDVPMLRWAGIGVAMGNALPEVRESVRYVTSSNDRDGVAQAIERFCLPAVAKKTA
jgi:Cof subfamily protein (haloacid dehalogenase superfamily)